MECSDGLIGVNEPPNDCIVDEDVGPCHLAECSNSKVRLAKARASREELVHGEGILVGVALDHGGMH